MLFLSDRLTSASGSIGGTTFSHNRFGLYTRARRKPVNPNTAAQQSVRDAFASGSAAWRSLTAVQREAWEVYAAATATVNALGQSVFLDGQQQFVASTSMLLRFGQPQESTAPLTPGRIPIGVPSIVIDASGLTVTIDDLEVPDDVAIGLFVGSPISAGRSFFAGPYQYRGNQPADTGAVAFATASGRNSLPYVAGQRIPYRLAGVNAIGPADSQGALTTEASGVTVVVA